MATFPPLCQVFKQGAERARGGKRHAMHSCGKQEKGGGGGGGLLVLPATISHTCYCTSTTVPRTPLISAKQKYSSLFPKREALLERKQNNEEIDRKKSASKNGRLRRGPSQLKDQAA